MTQENKKRFNIIDALLILTVLALFAGIFIRNQVADEFGLDKSEKPREGVLEYEFIITSLKETSRERFNVGDKFFDQNTKEEVGELLSVDFSPAEAYIELPTGEIVKTIIPERIDVKGKLKVDGTVDSNGRCLMDGTIHIAPGKTIYAHSNDISFMLSVEGVEFVPNKNTQK